MAKPLSADEVVKANAKKRAAGQQPAGPAKAVMLLKQWQLLKLWQLQVCQQRGKAAIS